MAELGAQPTEHLAGGRPGARTPARIVPVCSGAPMAAALRVSAAAGRWGLFCTVWTAGADGARACPPCIDAVTWPTPPSPDRDSRRGSGNWSTVPSRGRARARSMPGGRATKTKTKHVKASLVADSPVEARRQRQPAPLCWSKEGGPRSTRARGSYEARR